MDGEFALFQVTEGNLTKPDSFFSIFFKEHESKLVGCGPVQHYPPAVEIFHGNAPLEVVYLIERGIVKLSRIGIDGCETILGLRGQYCLLAAPAVFLSIPYTITATTLPPCRAGVSPNITRQRSALGNPPELKDEAHYSSGGERRNA